jgi:hypothetical protein
MKREISLDTLVMAKQAIDELLQFHLTAATKDQSVFSMTSDMRKRAYKASSEIDLATFILLKQTNLEITNGTGNS